VIYIAQKSQKRIRAHRQPLKSLKITVVTSSQTPLSFVTFLSLHVRVYLCSGLQKMHLFLHQSAFWPFKFVQGHPRSMILVRYQSKASRLYDFLLVRHYETMVLSCTVSEIRRLLAKIAYFCYIFAIPLSLGALAAYSLWNFALELTVWKLESWGYRHPPVKTA